MTTVLITGATGEVAQGVIPALGSEFDLRLLAPSIPEDDSRYIQADLLDWHLISEAMKGVDAVLHLAIASGHPGTYEDDHFNDCRFDVNVKGTYHVFEAAKRAGVKRVVHVSSLMVVWGHQQSMIPGDAVPKPVGTYALTKMLGEQVAQYYAESSELEVLTIRIAAPLDVNDSQLSLKTVRPQQISFPDLTQAFYKALTVPLTQYETVTIVGESSKRVWSLDKARQVLGYIPTINLDDLPIQWADPFDVDPNEKK